MAENPSLGPSSVLRGATSVRALTPAEPPRAARPLRVVVEVSERAGELVDPRVTRRLVALELSDVEVGPPHDAKTRPRSESVYFRVMVGNPNVLVVELWSRGELSGKRRVSTEGGTRLRARRIALVSAELARALQRRRRADETRAVARAAREALARRPQGELMLHGFFRTRAELLGAAVGGAELALLGPALSLGVQTDSGAGLDLRFEWLGGKTRLWYGASLRPYFGWSLGEPRRSADSAPPTELELGGSLALAGFRAANVPASAALDLVLHDWTARAVLDATARLPLFPHMDVGLGIEAGALLRPPSFAPASGTDVFGALWLGANLQLSVTSARR
jgi:hypothetical protein